MCIRVRIMNSFRVTVHQNKRSSKGHFCSLAQSIRACPTDDVSNAMNAPRADPTDEHHHSSSINNPSTLLPRHCIGCSCLWIQICHSIPLLLFILKTVSVDKKEKGQDATAK